MPSLRDIRPGAIAAGLWAWADERLGLRELVELALHKTVPQHRHSFWYYWGGMALFCFMLQVATGILLMFYYRPGPEAYDSVRQITHEVKFGWLIRSLHAWSANLMIAAVFGHMFSVLFMKAYRTPREFGWWSGLGLLGMSLVFGFSGYLLPMDELAYFATKVGLAIPSLMPGAAPLIETLIQGGPDVCDATLQRFFTLHVVALPLAFLPLLGFHLWLVQRHGNASPPSVEALPPTRRRAIPFFPDFMLKDLAAWIILFNLLVVLSALWPAHLGKPADPAAAAPAGIHPEWYFMSQFEVLKLFGRWFPGALGEFLGIAAIGLGGLLLAAIPLADPTRKHAARARWATAAAWALFLLFVATTILAYFDTQP